VLEFDPITKVREAVAEVTMATLLELPSAKL